MQYLQLGLIVSFHAKCHDTQHNETLDNNALTIPMPSVVMLFVAMPIVIMLSVAMLCVVKLIIPMLIVYIKYVHAEYH